MRIHQSPRSLVPPPYVARATVPSSPLPRRHFLPAVLSLARFVVPPFPSIASPPSTAAFPFISSQHMQCECSLYHRDIISRPLVPCFRLVVLGGAVRRSAVPVMTRGGGREEPLVDLLGEDKNPECSRTLPQTRQSIRDAPLEDRVLSPSVLSSQRRHFFVFSRRCLIGGPRRISQSIYVIYPLRCTWFWSDRTAVAAGIRFFRSCSRRPL